jgi:hypothetical protein
MGLDTSHNCWHGAYSAFNTWRTMIAKAAGLPPLDFMEGHYADDYRSPLYFARLQTGNKESFSNIASSLPIKWDCICIEKCPEALCELLAHSDCDGEIEWEICKELAEILTGLLPKMPDLDVGGHVGIVKKKTQQFIDGLLLAFDNKENVEFY